MDIIKIIKEEYEKAIDKYIKLGGGGFGKVFEYKGTAYKVTTDEDEARFSLKIKNYKGLLETFPKIYKVLRNNESDYYIIVRELITPLKLKPTEKAHFNNNIYKILKYVNSGNEEYLEYIMDSKIPDNIKDFIVNLRKDIEKVGMKKEGIDIHYNNIGLTKEGKYVLFDY